MSKYRIDDCLRVCAKLRALKQGSEQGVLWFFFIIGRIHESVLFYATHLLMKKIVIASGNAGKIKEIKHALNGFNLELISQKELNVTEVPETASTFVENALIKAKHTTEVTGLPALADDSGLVIESLNGEPGIYSARYAGEKSNDQSNTQKVLLEMQDFPDEAQRQAYFYCSMVFMQHVNDPAPLIATGRWHGVLLKELKGEGGFGYDPIFYVPTHHCSAAELELTEKNQISHRGLALQQLQSQFHDIIRSS